MKTCIHECRTAPNGWRALECSPGSMEQQDAARLFYTCLHFWHLLTIEPTEQAHAFLATFRCKALRNHHDLLDAEIARTLSLSLQVVAPHKHHSHTTETRLFDPSPFSTASRLQTFVLAASALLPSPNGFCSPAFNTSFLLALGLIALHNG